MSDLLIIGQTFIPHILHTDHGAGERWVGMVGELRSCQEWQTVLAPQLGGTATFVACGPSAEPQQHHVAHEMDAPQ